MSPDWIPEPGIGGTRLPAELHGGGCCAAGKRTRPLIRHRPRRPPALASGLRACTPCRPGTEPEVSSSRRTGAAAPGPSKRRPAAEASTPSGRTVARRRGGGEGHLTGNAGRGRQGSAAAVRRLLGGRAGCRGGRGVTSWRVRWRHCTGSAAGCRTGPNWPWPMGQAVLFPCPRARLASRGPPWGRAGGGARRM
ncbi:DUF6233 domain-containing protein [Streptomyces avermitilis]